ncbi:MAG: hypothetical protein ACT4O6_05525 [Reyranella sp.]
MIAVAKSGPCCTFGREQRMRGLAVKNTIERRELFVGTTGFLLVAGSARAQSPYAQYIGTWKGEWKGGLSITIDIQSIGADGTMQGVSSWGDKPEWKVKAGSAPFSRTKISANGKFSFPDTSRAGARADYAFVSGRLEGARFESPDGKPTNTAILTRAK